MPDTITVTRPSMPELNEYIEEISDLWESHWLTNMGIKHQQLQEKLREYLEVEAIELFTNGHMALELTLQALALEGEIITTPFTFASTTHAIIRNGLQPVFCDINDKDYTIDVSRIEDLITDRTCAILPVHVYGNVCDVEEIEKIASKHHLKVIYDAAHAFGVRYKGKSIALFGDASCFSFHATKMFNTIEGGACCYRDPVLGRTLYQLKNFGIRDEETVTLDNRNSTVYVNGEKKATRMLFAPVAAVERVVFRTGAHSDFPNGDTEADSYNDNPRANDVDKEAKFRIANFRTSSRDIDGSSAVLRYGDYAPYVDYFNNMEDENIAQAIPNSEASDWMMENIPLFECPDKDMEEMYYYRWWTLRKHIKNTPVGYGMTEFLVNRNYSDKYNLIACAIGHHIYESRWLRDQKYLDGIINTWYHGNEGKPMDKMMKFSSWNPDAVYGRYLVNGDLKRLEAMYADLKAEYARWEESNRLPNGLYWQRDVADGMEESISGGRRTRNARPSINSYMYGNAKALAAIADKLGKSDEKAFYEGKAKEMKDLVQSRLWSDEQQFFETVRGDTICMAREAIGYIPWYFNLPDSGKYDAAWLQLNDKKGFSAPYGLTTAERRHPEFRTRGVGKCEWDGAIWPFASAQTLTALANYLNSEENPVVSDSTYFAQMKLYVESQHHRGRPYIGEYLDEVTGY